MEKTEKMTKCEPFENERTKRMCEELLAKILDSNFTELYQNKAEEYQKNLYVQVKKDIELEISMCVKEYFDDIDSGDFMSARNWYIRLADVLRRKLYLHKEYFDKYGELLK